MLSPSSPPCSASGQAEPCCIDRRNRKPYARHDDTHSRNTQLTLATLLFTLYLITGSGGFHIIDEVSLYSVTDNLARVGAWDTDAIAWSQWINSQAEVLGAWGDDGHVYSKKGVARPWLMSPSVIWPDSPLLSVCCRRLFWPTP